MRVKASVVEDERQIRELSFGADRRWFQRCLKRPRWLHAASLSTTHPPSLILLDLGLPDRSGIDFIRDYRAWSAAPILVLSARAEEQDKVDALDASADDYLTKTPGIAAQARVSVPLLRRHPLTQATASATPLWRPCHRLRQSHRSPQRLAPSIFADRVPAARVPRCQPGRC